MLLGAGCATKTMTTTEAPAASSKAEYETAFAKAQAAVDKAASVGGEWRDISSAKNPRKSTCRAPLRLLKRVITKSNETAGYRTISG